MQGLPALQIGYVQELMLLAFLRNLFQSSLIVKISLAEREMDINWNKLNPKGIIY